MIPLLNDLQNLDDWQIEVASWNMDLREHFVSIAAFFESLGDKPRGPWATYLDHMLDHPLLTLAFTKIVGHLTTPDSKADTANTCAHALIKALTGTRHRTSGGNHDVAALSLADRDRLTDAIVGLNGRTAIAEDKNGNHVLTDAALKSLVAVVAERAFIKAVGTYFLRYADGPVVKTLAGARIPVNPDNKPLVASFTEEALGDDTQVNIPKQLARAPQAGADAAAAEITHNLTRRILVVTRKSAPEVVTNVATGKSHTIKVGELIYDHVLTVKRGATT